VSGLTSTRCARCCIAARPDKSPLPEVIDAAETYAARIPDPDRRAALLSAARLLRRIDQVVVKFAIDLGHAGEAVQPQNLPATA
jgi:hypothetical protein